VIGDPPSDAGVLHPRLTWPLPGAATTTDGASGTVIGVTAADGADAAPVPTPFDAATVKVYEVPLTSPVTMIGEAVPLTVIPPGLEVTA